ncbi:MAG TPA: UDP-glucose--sterol glucosyltransferase [Phycisphaerales bacterium]|nr:UDP-glucose--sterol glucosyltransferase [Phycisphaerales bacterium]HCD32785.1 UDP-glucose--sterol glucosyltransferase [Phycisphaerales bacterium]|tara:strand:- start:1737 stop:3032 length:1296 start_codon:yes stop_codon:yes gene_type:complete
MHIFITTIGTRGDVEPYVALGQRLITSGHRVTLCSCEKFRDFITEQGLEYGYLNNSFMELMQTDIAHDLMEKNSNIFEFIKSFLRLYKRVDPMQWEAIRDITRAAELAQPDLILYHPKAFIGAHVAQKLGIPKALTFLMPMMIPTGDRPDMGFPKLPLGRGYNRMTSWLMLKIMNMTCRKYVKGWRKEHGLDPKPRGMNFLHDHQGKPITYLHGYSSLVCKRPADWPEHVHVTGYWPMEYDRNWMPPDELTAFLEAGDPPVYVGFGSMSGRNPQRLTRIVIDAIKQAGVRAILATGWGGLQTEDLPDTIFKIDQVPHGWLFPRCDAVIHHGGAGTTAAGLRAGKPTVICPFAFDQPFWGKQVFELGVGSKPLPQRKLTATKLAAAIRKVTGDPSIQRKAQSLGEQLREEDGIGNAIAVIEKLVAEQSHSDR